MPLESLLKLAETLKTRVDVHRDTLGASETLTRYALIDPLLRELGWDTSDPSAVIPEYKTRQGCIADYALLKAGKPPSVAIMVEAKKLGTHLRDDSLLSQLLGCCTMEGVNHFAVTDGALWEIYETHKPVPIDQKLVAKFDLLADSPASFCLNALALRRPCVEAGLVEPASDIWHRFSDTGYAKGRKPLELKFPDNSRAGLRGWFSLFEETVRWLSRKGHLTKENCPVTLKGRCIVCADPPKANGIWEDVNGLYVHKHNLVKRQFERAMAVIEHVGQNPCQFRVRFA